MEAAWRRCHEDPWRLNGSFSVGDFEGQIIRERFQCFICVCWPHAMALVTDHLCVWSETRNGGLDEVWVLSTMDAWWAKRIQLDDIGCYHKLPKPSQPFAKRSKNREGWDWFGILLASLWNVSRFPEDGLRRGGRIASRKHYRDLMPIYERCAAVAPKTLEDYKKVAKEPLWSDWLSRRFFFKPLLYQGWPLKFSLGDPRCLLHPVYLVGPRLDKWIFQTMSNFFCCQLILSSCSRRRTRHLGVTNRRSQFETYLLVTWASQCFSRLPPLAEDVKEFVLLTSSAEIC